MSRPQGEHETRRQGILQAESTEDVGGAVAAEASNKLGQVCCVGAREDAVSSGLERRLGWGGCMVARESYPKNLRLFSLVVSRSKIY
jgi:hypothetical protein